MTTTTHNAQTKTGAGWHPEQIKAAVRMRGITLSELARRHGYGADACRLALRRPWPRVERIIADELGVPPSQLWPERYAEAVNG